MEKKIKALKAAYQTQDAVKIRNAARALVSYNYSHPMATCLFLPESNAGDIVRLAKRIVEAPAINL